MNGNYRTCVLEHCATQQAWGSVPASMLVMVSLLLAIPGLSAECMANETDEGRPIGAVGGQVTVDQFTGTATMSIPIEVPPGRNGMQPNLALVYESAGGNGWVGMGWKLEHEGIFRQTKWGVNYSNNAGDKAFTIKMSGISADLVELPSGEWRAKIESGFSRIQKFGSGANMYWVLTNKQGRKFYFGQSSTSRVYDPNDSTKVFVWCLDRVEDPDGNYMTFSYIRDDGQLYLDQIDYAGHSTGLSPTNRVKFVLEGRPDAPPMHTSHFRIRTAKRLNSITLWSDLAMTKLVRKYQLSYTPSASTGRSLLTGLQQFGADGVTALPLLSFPASTATNGLTEQVWASNIQCWGAGDWTWVGDLNGDGMHDVASRVGGTICVKRSTGNSVIDEAWTTNAPNWGASGYTWPGDFNGDGLTDIATAVNGTIWVKKSTGTGFVEEPWATNAPSWGASGYTWPGDFNGDGMTDIATANNGTIYVKKSTGTGFIEETWTTSAPNWGQGIFTWPGDFNGDGRTDIATASYGNIWVKRSTGDSFIEQLWTSSAPNWGDGYHDWVGDFNGDGKTDIGAGYGNYMWVKSSTIFPVDLVQTMSNGIGGTTLIGYIPSTWAPAGTHTKLPYPVQTVQSIVTSPGAPFADSSLTTYSYTGGYHHFGEREFRGFRTVYVKAPIGANGEFATTQTIFLQGNGTGPSSDDPSVPHGYMKGKPISSLVLDQQPEVLSVTTWEYHPDGQAPFFNPLKEVRVDTFSEGNVLQTKIEYVSYDEYGNVLEERHHGDTSDTADDRTIVRTFAPANTAQWLIGFPTQESVWQGIPQVEEVSRTTYAYDGTSPDCVTVVGSGSVIKGNLTNAVRVHLTDGSKSAETRTSYDAYGNAICTRDPRGNKTLTTFDATQTFPLTITNPLNHVTTTAYYGVNGVSADAGLYGQMKSVTDSNGQTTTVTYDALGRKLTIVNPNGLQSATIYSYPGTIGTTQFVQTTTSGGGLPESLITKTFFDGLGRVIRKESTGPKDGGPTAKTLVTETEYDTRGLVVRSSLPYFKNAESATGRWRTMTYDALGRLTQTTNPDNTTNEVCHTGWITTTIDARQHKKRERRDAEGRVVEIEEYTGIQTDCATSGGTLYAYTRYEYDVLGNLRFVKDAKGNETERNTTHSGGKRT
ncbi:MAG: FG-GAP-like repeat-containing protein [Nitrospiraceae bacterium]